MKKRLLLLGVLALLLTGCGAQETFETLSDVYVQAEPAQMQQVILNLSENAAVDVMRNDSGGSIYFCDGYTVTVQILESGDLDATLRQVTGFSRERLQILQTAAEDADRYDCVWTAAGEQEEQVGRAAVLDDGNYHYAVTVMADASASGALTEVWQQLLDSLRLVPAGSVISTGS